MYYDEITHTWFDNEIQAFIYHRDGVLFDDPVTDAYEDGLDDREDVIDYDEYEKLEERCGNYSTGFDLLKEALLRALQNSSTIKSRNEIREFLTESLPDDLLEELPIELTEPEKKKRRSKNLKYEELPF